MKLTHSFIILNLANTPSAVGSKWLFGGSYRSFKDGLYWIFDVCIIGPYWPPGPGNPFAQRLTGLDCNNRDAPSDEIKCDSNESGSCVKLSAKIIRNIDNTMDILKYICIVSKKYDNDKIRHFWSKIIEIWNVYDNLWCAGSKNYNNFSICVV